MGDASNGIKAGAVAGVVFAVISAIFIVISMVMFKDNILIALQHYMSSHPIYAQNGYTAQKLYNDFLITEPVFYSIIGIILGLILGLIYGIVGKRIPGKSQVLKGVIFGLVLWIILGVLLNVRYISQYSMTYFELTTVGYLIASLVYGYVLASLFNRFGKVSRVTVTEPVRPS